MSTAILQKVIAGNAAYDIPLRQGRGFMEVRVTPDIAKHWLTFNSANREINQSHVEMLQRYMERGEFNFSGSPICFSYGKLIDGQHRLTALVLAGLTITMLVVFGLDPEVQSRIDTGIKVRKTKDVICIEGAEPWESGVIGTAIHTMLAVANGGAIYSHKKFDNHDAKNFYLENKASIERSMQRIKPYPRKNSPLPMSKVLALHFIFAKRDAMLADKFCDQLCYGDGIAKTSPMYHLRNMLMGDLIHGKTRTVFKQFYACVVTWNAMRSGNSWKTPGSLHQSTGTGSFPEIK